MPTTAMPSWSSTGCASTPATSVAARAGRISRARWAASPCGTHQGSRALLAERRRRRPVLGVGAHHPLTGRELAQLVRDPLELWRACRVRVAVRKLRRREEWGHQRRRSKVGDREPVADEIVATVADLVDQG